MLCQVRLSHSRRVIVLIVVLLAAILSLSLSVSAAPPGPDKTEASTQSQEFRFERQQGVGKLGASTGDSLAPSDVASPPTNDDFDIGYMVNVLPFLDVRDTTQATLAADDPGMGCGQGRNSHTVWYRFVPDFSGVVIAHTFGSNYDTVLAVFVGGRGNLTSIDCNDDAPGSHQSQMSFFVSPGQSYYVEVASYGALAGGNLALSFHRPNDDFDDATTIRSTPFQAIIDTRPATVTTDDPDMGCGNGRNSNTVWYRIMPATNGTIEVETHGSSYDTVLAVFTGSRGALNLITCSDDEGGRTSQVTIEAQAGVAYYIEVADYGSPGGGLLLLTVKASSVLRNAFIQVISADDGRFVLGTTGGDPEADNDNDKRLLYGYPDTIGSSYATVRVQNGGTYDDIALAYPLQPLSGPFVENNAVTTVWNLAGIRVAQRLIFAANPDSGRQDMLAIEYTLTNETGAAREVGLRSMLDTMIGDNDGAPFFLAGWGRLLNEREFRGTQLPSYWIAWESPDFDADYLKGKGLLVGQGTTAPDRVIVAHWGAALCQGAGPGLFDALWDYTANAATSITCDSAIALYFNPVQLQSGQSRVIRAHYGLAAADNAIELAADVAGFVGDSRQDMHSIATAASDVATVGDYFLDYIDVDSVQLVLGLFLNALEFASLETDWARAGRGLSHIATPGYEASLHASWRGWIGDAAAKHWYKPAYDAFHNNAKLLAKQTTRAGIEYYAKEVGKEVIEEWLPEILVPGQGSPFDNYFGQPAQRLGNSYATELQREQDDFLAWLAVQPLTDAQVDAYRMDILARRQVHEQLLDQLHAHRDLQWHSYQKRLEDEAKWWKFLVPMIAKWAVVGGATLLWDGPGFYVASIATTGLETVIEAIADARALARDARMVDLSMRFLSGRVTQTYGTIALNTVNALNLIRAGDPPQMPLAQVSVFGMESFGHYRLWPKLWWAEEAAELTLSIEKQNDIPTTFVSSVAYNQTGFWGGAQRLLVEGEVAEWQVNGRRTVEVFLKGEEWGESPDDGSWVDILVLGATATGLYPIVDTGANWNPSKVERLTGQAVTPPRGFTLEEIAQAPTYPYPLSTHLVAIPGSKDFDLTVSILNPFEMTVSAVVSQSIPSTFAVLDTGNATLQGDKLIWQIVLEPESGTEWHARLRWQGGVVGSVSLVEAEMNFHDPITGNGDTYRAVPETVAAPWPLISEATLPKRWPVHDNNTIVLNLTSLSDQTVQAQVTILVEDMSNATLWTETRALTLADHSTQRITFLAPTPQINGYAVVRGQAEIGNQSKILFEEIVELPGHQTFLPFMAR